MSSSIPPTDRTIPKSFRRYEFIKLRKINVTVNVSKNISKASALNKTPCRFSKEVLYNTLKENDPNAVSKMGIKDKYK